MERWKTPLYRRRSPVCSAPVSVNSYHPSFSSSLLDAIDRSIDKGAAFGEGREGKAAEGTLSGRVRLHWASQEPHDKKQSYTCGRVVDKRYFRQPAYEFHRPLQQRCGRYSMPQQPQMEQFFGNSTSSSSASSCGGFSSSEAESVVPSAPPLPRPVRTSAPVTQGKPSDKYMASQEERKQKEKVSIRSKFRACKLYGELKKGRSTPVSPGARLASFINTLFSAAGHPRKAKISISPNAVHGSRGGDDSACSSASSYSRSCLSKTPSSRGNAPSSGGGTKRSVRFCPVNLILDEDRRHCHQKCRYDGLKPSLRKRSGFVPALTDVRTRWEEPPLVSGKGRGETPQPSYASAMEEADERKRAREAAMELVSAYKDKKMGLGSFAGDEDEDDDDDAASYSSSDLFELKNLQGSIGCGGEVRYRDELPVYETTRLDSNRPIARGLIVRSN